MLRRFSLRPRWQKRTVVGFFYVGVYIFILWLNYQQYWLGTIPRVKLVNRQILGQLIPSVISEMLSENRIADIQKLFDQTTMNKKDMILVSNEGKTLAVTGPESSKWIQSDVSDLANWEPILFPADPNYVHIRYRNAYDSNGSYFPYEGKSSVIGRLYFPPDLPLSFRESILNDCRRWISLDWERIFITHDWFLILNLGLIVFMSFLTMKFLDLIQFHAKLNIAIGNEMIAQKKALDYEIGKLQQDRDQVENILSGLTPRIVELERIKNRKIEEIEHLRTSLTMSRDDDVQIRENKIRKLEKEKNSIAKRLIQETKTRDAMEFTILEMDEQLINKDKEITLISDSKISIQSKLDKLQFWVEKTKEKRIPGTEDLFLAIESLLPNAPPLTNERIKTGDHHGQRRIRETADLIVRAKACKWIQEIKHAKFQPQHRATITVKKQKQPSFPINITLEDDSGFSFNAYTTASDPISAIYIALRLKQEIKTFENYSIRLI